MNSTLPHNEASLLHSALRNKVHWDPAQLWLTFIVPHLINTYLQIFQKISSE